MGEKDRGEHRWEMVRVFGEGKGEAIRTVVDKKRDFRCSDAWGRGEVVK